MKEEEEEEEQQQQQHKRVRLQCPSFALFSNIMTKKLVYLGACFFFL